MSQRLGHCSAVLTQDFFDLDHIKITDKVLDSKFPRYQNESKLTIFNFVNNKKMDMAIVF